MPVLLLLLLALAAPAAAAPADLDPAFAGDGVFTTTTGTGLTPSALTVRPDGAVVVVGRSLDGIVVLRLRPDGQPDPTFGGGDGMVAFDTSAGFEGPGGIAVLPDGRLLVTGTHTQGPGDMRILLLRLLPDGQPDPTLNADGDADGVVVVDVPGSTRETIGEVALLPDGRFWGVGNIRAGGAELALLARFHPSGALDLGHNATGYRAVAFPGQQDTIATGMVARPDGRLVAGGLVHDGLEARQALIGFTGAGALDPAVDGDGRTVIDPGPRDEGISAFTAGAAGTLIGAGYAYQGPRPVGAISRFDAAGVPDPAFGGGGHVQIAPPGTGVTSLSALAVQADGGVVAAGRTGSGMDSKLLLARVGPGGAPDDGYGPGGALVVDIAEGTHEEGEDVAVLPDGRILVLGGFFSGLSNELVVLALRGTATDPPAVGPAPGGATTPGTPGGGAAGRAGAATAGPARDTTAPRVTRVRIVRARTRRGARRLRLTLSEAAMVRVAIVRHATGKRRRLLRRRAARAGALHVALPRRGLRAGTYRAAVTATDAAGNRSRRVTVRFRVR